MHTHLKIITMRYIKTYLLTASMARNGILFNYPHTGRSAGTLKLGVKSIPSQIEVSSNLLHLILSCHTTSAHILERHFTALSYWLIVERRLCEWLKSVASALLMSVPHLTSAMAQQQITNQFNDRILKDLGIDIFEDYKSSTPITCKECQRMRCICDRNTSSSITINSEDSLRHKQYSSSDRYFSDIGEDGDEEEEEDKDRRWRENRQLSTRDKQLAADICWEDWRDDQDEGGAQAEQKRERQLRAERCTSGRAPPNEPHTNENLPEWYNRVQSPIDPARQRQTFVRPIMLQPANMFDSDLKIFFIRSLRDVRLLAGSESMVATDIEFHPFLTAQGVKSIQSWAACVTPLPASSPYFSEILSFCMVRGGTVELCLETQKPLAVAIVNGSTCRDAVIYAGSVIAVLEMCSHRY